MGSGSDNPRGGNSILFYDLNYVFIWSDMSDPKHPISGMILLLRYMQGVSMECPAPSCLSLSVNVVGA